MDKNPSSWQALLPELVLMALLAVLFTWNAAAFEIDPYSEIFHLVAAKQTAHAGHFWIPSINGHDYLIRPPFWTWLITLLFKIFGASLWVARIPAVLFALAGAALTYLITLELSPNRMAGLFAVGILGTTWGYFHLGTLSTADIMVTVLYLGYFLALLKWHNIASRRNPLPLEINVLSAVLGAIIGLLLLVKGALSAGLMVFIGLVYLFLHQDLFLIGRLNLRLLTGCVAVFLLPWIILGSFATKNMMFFADYLLVQPFERMLATGPWQGLRWDPMFYLKRLPTDLLPYLLFLPAALVECVLPRRTASSFQMQQEFWTLWLPVWFFTGMLIYSLSAFQEPTLLLPFYPAVAILVGHYLGRATESVSGSDLYNNTVSVYILALMLVAVLCSIIIFQVIPSDYVKGFWHLPGQPLIEFLQIKDHRIDLQEAFPLWKFWMVPGPFILLLGGLALYVLQLLRRNTAGAFAIVGTSLLFLLFVKMIYLPILHRPVPQQLAQQISQKISRDDTVVLYSLHPDIKRVLFYLDDKKVAQARLVRNSAGFQKILNESNGTVYGVIREESFFNDIDYSYRNLLRVNQFNWKWDMTQLAELRKLLAIRQPMFNRMKSEMMSFQSVPTSSIRALRAEMGLQDNLSPDEGVDRRSMSRAN
jgi:4-amino-4-deoxy-L-arabinose transferase-like glycosyltransferase